ncbi:MAG: Hydrogenase isoenzymes formation protein HypC [Syntrophorhabdus sp. PtaU1.Bin002]|nr:MAG: Hydrogenase isoenzymes formation protein HypC [Syntrophorhabdus sp. PtaU1.Bin002]
MRLETVAGTRGAVAVDGVRRDVRLDLVEGARPGDWVLVHAGFAIQLLDETAAAETLALLGELLAEPPGASPAIEPPPGAPPPGALPAGPPPADAPPAGAGPA